MYTTVVVDDDASIRAAIASRLRQKGHRVLAFDDAALALDAVNFAKVDLVITDLEMPMLGEQFILILRERGIAVPVIVISAHINDDRTRYLEDLGVHHILGKPFQVSQLMTMIKEMVRLSERG